MATTGVSNYIGRSAEQINNAYLFPPFHDFQYGTWNTGTTVPGAGSGVTLAFTFPVPFEKPPFAILTYTNNITSINSQCWWTLMNTTTTQMQVRVQGPAGGTGGASPMNFNWMAWTTIN